MARQRLYEKRFKCNTSADGHSQGNSKIKEIIKFKITLASP